MALSLPAPVRRPVPAALLAAVLPVAVGAQAPPVTIVGYVTDTAAVAVPAAEVLVDGTALHTRTDAQGAFRFTGVRPGRLTITVRRLGFRSRRDEFQPGAGDTLQLIFDLVALPAELAEVTVTEKRVPRRSTWLDEFESRRQRGFGTFLTRTDIERRNPRNTSDLFRTVAGVTVVPNAFGGDLRMARSMDCAPDIYIDGMEARGLRIDVIPPADIAGIEVFRGPAETPVRFRRFMAGCGVISVWTRPPGS